MSDERKEANRDEFLLITDNTKNNKSKVIIRIIIITSASILIALTILLLIFVFLAKPYDNTWLSNFLLSKSDNAIETELEKLKSYYFMGSLLTIAIVLLIFFSVIIKKLKNKK